MVAVRLTLLGGFDARLAAGEAISLPTKRAQALLAYLGLRPGQPHQRDKLAALLWGERSDTQARDGLRHALAVLRKALAGVSPPPLLVEGQTLALDPAVVEVDVATFEHRLAEGTSEPLERAAELYQGDLLLGFAVNEPLFEEWLVAERERLRELALEALARLLAHQTKTGRTERAIQTAVRLLGLDPLQEPVHRTLMRLYARQGRRGTALKQYQVCVATLQRELGTEPETETKALYQELLRRPAPAARTRNHEGDDPARPARLAGRARVELPAGDTPLVGREVELRRLRELLEEAIGGRGHVAIVTGEAGVGKTRLLATLVTEAVDRDCRVLIGRGHDGEAILPFGPWVDACRAGEIGPQEEAVAALAPVWRAELSRLLPDVGARGLPSPGNSDLRLFESVAQLVEQLAARRPVMLLLEDLHWADDMSMRLLSFVSRRVRRWGVLLVATAREEELDEAVLARRILGELARQPGTVPLALSPLSRPDTTCLVQALAWAGIEADEMARLETHVWAVSEGNPFVAIESIRAFQEGSIPPGSSRRPIPQRVREIVIGRLERLSDAARQLVAVAAVIGREFDFPLVQRAAGLDDITAARAVEELVRRLVFSGTGERLDFTHDRIRVAAYGELVPPRRKLLHRQAGEALEALHACDLDPHALALGVHFREGEAWEKAGWYMWRAGTQAVARSAYRQAVASFEEALAALRHLPQTPERLAQAVDLHLEARQALYPLGEVEGIFAHLQAAEAAVVTLGDQRRLAAVLADLTLYFLQVAELARGVTTGQRAVALADALDDFGLSVAANQYLGQIHLNLGAFRDAKAIFQRHRGALEGDLLREHFGMAGYPSVFYRSLLGYCHAELGEFVEAVVLGERAIGIAEDVEQPYACAVARSWLGRTHLVRGDFDRASRVLEQALDIAEARELGWPALGAELGYARAMSGQLPDGLRLLERAARLPQAQSPGRVFTWLGEAYLMAGRLADGAAAARRALALARHHHQRGIEASALSLLGQIALSEDAPHAVDAEEPYRQALALAEELGMRPLVAHCHLGLGKLYRRTGKREQAHEHLTVATTMYRNMGMTYWLEKVEAEVREVG